MLRNCPTFRISILSLLTSAALFAVSASAQSPSAQASGTEKETSDLQGSKTVAESKPLVRDPRTGLLVPSAPVATATPDTTDVKSELDAVKAENEIVREQMHLMMEQQRKLLDQVGALQRKLDNDPKKDPQSDDASTDLSSAAARPGDPTDPGVASVKKAQDAPERYQDGIIIWKTPDDAKVPFLLRFNNNTQFRYLNTMDSPGSFTDHLGNVREVHTRNDLTVNRSMFILGGYIFDKRVRYSLTVWTSAGSASIVVAGNIGWQFNKHITLIGGYFGVPGSRSLVNTFPYYTATDRSMADNFFRPGFTQGVTALGEITKGLNYNVFVGNSLNTLSISAAKIDTNLMYAGSVWWEPFGEYAPPGKSQEMYDDYSGEKKVRMRIGTSFTRSREDRFSNLDVSNPDNTALYNSDGVLTFSTGAFAPGVTVDKALYKMWAIDWGLKYNGWAINGQYYSRWLSDFEADGPMPLASTFDKGYELSVGKFVIPRKLMVYARSSQVWGEFNNPYEYGAGVKWHFLPTERLWINAELMKVKGAPYSGAFSPYTAGMSGWVPMVQTVIAF